MIVTIILNKKRHVLRVDKLGVRVLAESRILSKVPDGWRVVPGLKPGRQE